MDPAWLALVIAISDGDTMTILHDQQQIKVRLAEIDAPEKRQAFGARSRESLSYICFQAQAKIQPMTKDRYGRTVARVICDGIDASVHQMESGMAWYSRKYYKDPLFPALEEEARAAQRGLWADPTPTPPWEWRRMPRH